MKTTTTLMALAFAALIAGPAAAQDPAPAAPPPAPQAAPVQEKAQDKAKTQTATGELVKVDSEKMTLSDGAELTISYNAQTEISGEQKNAQGLAAAEGSKVVVHYTATDSAKTATKIKVEPAKKM